MSATAATRGVTRLNNVIRIDYTDHCAALRQEADSLYLQTVILSEQRAALTEQLQASEATAAALFARVAELEAREGLRRPSRALALWGALCLAWWRLRDAWAKARAEDDTPAWAWPSLAMLVMFAIAFVRF